MMTMKRVLLALSTLLAVGGALARDVDVGVSVQIGQPGFYGRIDIGDAPRPRLIYAEPVIISRPPPRMVYEPVYLRVPPGHERHWRKHCHRYDACGRPVYFVRDDWYQRVYVPHYYERYPEYRQDRRDDRRDDWRDDHRRGHGHGRGHDRD
jgi:hypothetical protein